MGGSGEKQDSERKSEAILFILSPSALDYVSGKDYIFSLGPIPVSKAHCVSISAQSRCRINVWFC